MRIDLFIQLLAVVAFINVAGSTKTETKKYCYYITIVAVMGLVVIFGTVALRP